VGSHGSIEFLGNQAFTWPALEPNLQALWNQGKPQLNPYGHALILRAIFPAQVLTGERCHDRCFFCGPKGNHYLPLLPPYPEEWGTFLRDRKTGSLSRKFNQLFSLTALGVHDGDFMHFSPDDLQIPREWINSALARLERVNPFISELENLNVYHDDDDIALHLQYSDSDPSAEIAAIISLAPASLPTRRKLVFRKKGADAPVFLDLFPSFCGTPALSSFASIWYVRMGSESSQCRWK
jgi:hypothetical protein